MARKIIIGVTAAILLGAIPIFSGFAAEKAQAKKAAEKPKQQAKAGQQPKQQKELLDQLIVAYKANDKEKMGVIIKKMEGRRDQVRKLAKLNKWHQGVHRRWAQAGDRQGTGWAMRGQGRGLAMGGPGWGRGGRGGQMMGGQPCRRPCCWQDGYGGWGRQGGMQNWRQQPGGFGAMRQLGPSPQRPGVAPRAWNRPSGNVPPADWGW